MKTNLPTGWIARLKHDAATCSGISAEDDTVGIHFSTPISLPLATSIVYALNEYPALKQCQRALLSLMAKYEPDYDEGHVALQALIRTIRR